MYTEWFKLTALPFRLRPDPDFLYFPDESARALDAARLALRKSRGVMLLPGNVGLGKTTLLRSWERDCSGALPMACLYQSELSPTELHTALAIQFGLGDQDGRGKDARLRVGRFLAAESSEGRHAVVLVDNAQNLPEATLRDLLSLGASVTAPVVVLAGTPEFLEAVRLAAPSGSRSIVRLPSLRPLDPDDLRGYVKLRMKLAGSSAEGIFEDSSFEPIHRFTGGIPRLVNALCDRALMLAEINGQRLISARHVRDTALDLEWMEYRPSSDGDTEHVGEEAAWSSDLGSIESIAHRSEGFELLVTFRGEQVTRHLLRPGRTIIGRGVDADLRLHSDVISRHHCQILTTQDQAIIQDLGSTNGFEVNGQRMKLHRLMALDRIKIGHHEIMCIAVQSS